MSGASRRRKARARQLRAGRDQQKKIDAFDREQSSLALQIRLAGTTPTSIAGRRGGRQRIPTGRSLGRAVTRYRGPIKDSRTGRVLMQVSNPNYNPQNRRSRPYTRIAIPPASAKAGLQRALAISKAKEQVSRASWNVRQVNQIPISLQVGSSRSGRTGANRRARSNFAKQQSINIPVVKRKHSANVDLWSAQKNLANLQGKSFDTPPPTAPFIIQSASGKIKTLSKQSGFDVGKQLKKTNERFGLNLGVDDVTANFSTGGLLKEATSLFARNRKIDELKGTLTPEAPTTVNLDENSDFDLLFNRRKSIVSQQKTRLDQINTIGDEDLRIARIETELPLFNERAGQIDGLIGKLNTRITDLKKTRKPQELLSATGSLQNFSLKTLVERRNQLTKIRNEKVDVFNQIDDPALRQVTKEQDIPQFDKRIGELDSNIDQAVKFGQNRKQINIAIENAPTKRRGRAPKTFDVTIGDTKKTFRRTERGAREAQIFFTETKKKKAKELESITDPINKAVARDQDLGILDLGVKASKQQRKALRTEKRNELESLNIGGASGSSFLPFTPADTPTGKLSVQSIPKGRGVPKVFDQLNFGGRKGGKRGRINPNEFDLGNLFGNRGVEKINKRKNAGFDFI